MIFPIVLVVGVVVWMILIKMSDDYSDVPLLFGFIGWAIIIVWFIVLMISYSSTKAELRVIDERIAVTEENNKERIESVLPVLEKYPEMEKDIIKDINPNSFAILGDVYPDLKSNESYNKQAQIVSENIARIEALQNEKLDLKSELYALQYHIWFLK